MAEVSWYARAGIGAVGGLALAMLKLIESKFFLAKWPSVDAQAA